MKKIIRYLFILILLIGIILFVYSGFNIYKWYIDSNNTAKIIDKINSIANNPENSLSEDNLNTTSDNGMDLSQFKEINPDTVGWIKVNGTNINYPFTQTDNNKFYLTHSFDKSYNAAGWVFLDYRNDINNFGKNTILYAHGRLDKTMFGSLQNVLEPEWFNDANNHIITISTDTQTTTWQIFSTYHTPVTSDYMQIDFNSDDEFMSFIDKIKSRSAHNFDTTVDASDKILTLSTCYNNNGKERMVVFAKMI